MQKLLIQETKLVEQLKQTYYKNLVPINPQEVTNIENLSNIGNITNIEVTNIGNQIGRTTQTNLL